MFPSKYPILAVLTYYFVQSIPGLILGFLLGHYLK